MAELKVTVKQGDGLQGYSVKIDGEDVPMGADDKGTKVVAGSCGDGSNHRASYRFVGPAGTKFGLTIKCGADKVVSINAKVPAATAPNAADYVEFPL